MSLALWASIGFVTFQISDKSQLLARITPNHLLIFYAIIFTTNLINVLYNAYLNEKDKLNGKNYMKEIMKYTQVPIDVGTAKRNPILRTPNKFLQIVLTGCLLYASYYLILN